MTIVQYVDIDETIADLAIGDKSSASLTTASSILLSVLFVVSFLSNVLLVATVLASYKLRKHLLYVLYAQLAAINVVDCVLVMSVALVYVANGTWTFGSRLCRVNAFAQEFTLLFAFFTLTLMAMERALGLSLAGRHLLTPRYVLALSALFAAIALCFAVPTAAGFVRVQSYPYRFLCAVGGHAPVAYTILNVVVYGGCLFVLSVCFGALVRYTRVDRSLPARPQDVGNFIVSSHALQEHLRHSRLVFYLCLVYALIQGPYIMLSWFVQIRNSSELLVSADELEVSQDIDTAITWLKLFFPLISTIFVSTHALRASSVS